MSLLLSQNYLLLSRIFFQLRVMFKLAFQNNTQSQSLRFSFQCNEIRDCVVCGKKKEKFIHNFCAIHVHAVS